MTDDLTQLLHRHVASDEPMTGLDPAGLMVLGRRRRRRRRALVAAAVAVPLAVAALALPEASVDTRGADPVASPSPSPARPPSPEALPPVVVDHADEVFGRSIADLPPGAFVAEVVNGAGRTLGPGDYDQAESMSVTYRVTPGREVRLALAQARGNAEGPASGYCSDDYGIDLSCDVVVLPDGSPAIERTMRVVRIQDGWLADVDLFGDRPRWYLRTLKVIRTDSFVAYASESVRAATDGSNPGFVVPVEDLTELADDPVLYFPPPGG